MDAKELAKAEKAIIEKLDDHRRAVKGLEEKLALLKRLEQSPELQAFLGELKIGIPKGDK